jgi:hypothetical protein
MKGTFNYKNKRGSRWMVIDKRAHYMENRNNRPRCELFNFNVDDPPISVDNYRKGISGVLTDRDKYTGKRIFNKKFYKTLPNGIDIVDYKQIGDRYLVSY